MATKKKSPRTATAAPKPAPADCLYPTLRAYRTGKLKVSAIHELYYEESGNP